MVEIQFKNPEAIAGNFQDPKIQEAFKRFLTSKIRKGHLSQNADPAYIYDPDVQNFKQLAGL